MADETDRSKSSRKKCRLDCCCSLKAFNRIADGVDEFYFGGQDEPKGEKKPPHEKPIDEPEKHEDDAK